MADSTQKRRGGDPILRRIDQIRRTVALWTLAWGYLWVVLLVAVLVFGGVLADHAFVLQKWGRLAFFRAFLFSLAAAALAATLYPLLRRVSRLYVARRMEQQRPELRNSLISYLQCREDPGIPGEVKGLMARRAAGQIRSLDAAVAVDYSPYMRLAAAVGVVVVAFVLYWAFSPKSAGLSLERLFHPRADIGPPTATQLYDVKPGELYVLRGARPALAASVRGVRPQGVWAVWDGATFTGRRILLSQKDGDGWQGVFPPVLEDGGYYLAAGDTRTDRFGIHVVPRPAVEVVRLDITPPAYTGLAPWTVENADAEAPAGSQVRVLATASVPPASGYMDFGNGRRTYLDPVPGRQALGGSLTLLDSGTYEVHFESTAYPDGSTFSNDEPVAYRLTCLPDRAPTATLSAPPDGIHAEGTDTVQVTYGAADDYGVARVRLLYSVTGITMQAVEIAQPGVREVKDARYAWDLASTSAQPGQTVTYRIEAEDNLPGRAQTGQSETRHIIINPREGAPPQATAPAAQPPADRQQQLPQQQPQPNESRQPAQQGAEPAAQQPPATPQQPAPEDEEDKGAIQKYVDYVRSIYDALGMEPPGQETTPGEQTASAERTGAAEANQSGDRTQPGGQGQGAQAQQPAGAPGPAQQGSEGSGQTASGQQAQAGGQPSESAAGQEGQQGQGATGQPAEQGAEGQGQQATGGQAGAQQPSGQEAGGQTAEGSSQASGQGAEGASGQEVGTQGAQGASGQGGSQQAGSQGAQGASGQSGSQQTGGQIAEGASGQSGSQQAGSQGAQGASGQTGGQEAGSQGAQGASGQQAGSQGGQGASGQQAAGQAAQGTGPGQPSGAPQGGGSGRGIQALPPIPEPTPKTLPALKDLDSAVENLSRMLDEDRIPPHVYRDLGLNREKLREFIDEYRRRRAESSSQQPPQPSGRLSEEAGRLLQGASAAGSGVRVQDTRPAKPTPDALHSRFEGADRLSSRYRDLVNQYYKALSEEQ